jgi:hypothetical protein
MKISLHPVTLNQIKHTILFSFANDEELQRNIPNPKESYEQTVERIYNCIRDLFKCSVYEGSKIELYNVILDSEFGWQLIGYTVLIKNTDIPHELYSFAIKSLFRDKETVLAWLAEIDKSLGDYYYIGLHNENSRAINFFLKNGFEKHEETQLFVLLFRNFDKLVEIKEKQLQHAG